MQRRTHNKTKIKVKYITGNSYEHPKYQSNNLLNFLRINFLFIGAIFICNGYGLYSDSQQTQFISPIGGASVFGGDIKVQAQEPSPTPEPVFESEVEAYIYEVFGEDYEDARTVAHCESKLRPGVVGDTTLMHYDSKNDEMVGDSIGVFQIRTGGSNWNRARANDLSAEQFRTNLKDYKYNIDYAKTIFDRGQWSAWTCKKDL